MTVKAVIDLESELIGLSEQPEFAREIIRRRGFIRAKHYSWTEPRNGLITHASPRILTVLFLANIGASVSYYTIKISEVAAGAWDLIYTNDFEHFYKIAGGETEEQIDLPSAVKKLFEESDENGDNENGADSGSGDI